jgi:hypothetical protein
LALNLQKGSLNQEVKKLQGMLLKEKLATQAMHAQFLQCKEEKIMLEHQNF